MRTLGLIIALASCAEEGVPLPLVVTPDEPPLPACSGPLDPTPPIRVAEDARDVVMGRCGHIAYRDAAGSLIVVTQELESIEVAADARAPVMARSGRAIAYGTATYAAIRDLVSMTEQRIDATDPRYGFAVASDGADLPYICSGADGMVREPDGSSYPAACPYLQGGSIVIGLGVGFVRSIDLEANEARLVDIDFRATGEADPEGLHRGDGLYLTRDGRVLAHQVGWHVTCGDAICRETAETAALLDLEEEAVIGDVPGQLPQLGHAEPMTDTLVESAAPGHVLLLEHGGMTSLLDERLAIRSLGAMEPLHLSRDRTWALAQAGQRIIRYDLTEERSETLIEARAIGGSYRVLLVSDDDRAVAIPLYDGRCIEGRDGQCHTQVFELAIAIEGQLSHRLLADNPIDPKWIDGSGRVLAHGPFFTSSVPDVADPSPPAAYATCLFDPAGAPIRCWADGSAEEVEALADGRLAIVFRGQGLVSRLEVVEENGDSEIVASDEIGIALLVDESRRRLAFLTNTFDYSLPDELWVVSR